MPDYNCASQDIFSPASDRVPQMQTMRQGSCKGLYSGVVPALSNPLERKIRRGSCAFRRSSMEKSLSCRLILVWCSRMSVTLRVCHDWQEGNSAFLVMDQQAAPRRFWPVQSITSTGGCPPESSCMAFGKKSTGGQRRRLRDSGSEHSQHLLQITPHTLLIHLFFTLSLPHHNFKI